MSIKEETLKQLLKGFYSSSACFQDDSGFRGDFELMVAMKRRGWKAADFKAGRLVYKQANDISIIEGSNRWNNDIIESLKEVGRL